MARTRPLAVAPNAVLRPHPKAWSSCLATRPRRPRSPERCPRLAPRPHQGVNRNIQPGATPSGGRGGGQTDPPALAPKLDWRPMKEQRAPAKEGPHTDEQVTPEGASTWQDVAHATKSRQTAHRHASEQPLPLSRPGSFPLTRHSAARRRSAAFGPIEVRAWQLTADDPVTTTPRRWTTVDVTGREARPGRILSRSGDSTPIPPTCSQATRRRDEHGPGASLTALMEADTRYPSILNSATCESTKSAHTSSTKVRGNSMALALDD